MRGDRRRHRARADPGRPRGALFLRRRAREYERRDDGRAAVRDRRDVVHGGSWGEPSRVDVAARGTDLGVLGGDVDSIEVADAVGLA